METIQFLLPVWAAHYFEYGYSDTLTEKECTDLDNLTKGLIFLGADLDNHFFQHGNDLYRNMGDDVCTFTFRPL